MGQHQHPAACQPVEWPQSRSRRLSELEHLALELVDALGGSVPLLGKDLTLHLLDIDLELSDHAGVVVDHSVDHGQ